MPRLRCHQSPCCCCCSLDLVFGHARRIRCRTSWDAVHISNHVNCALLIDTGGSVPSTAMRVVRYLPGHARRSARAWRHRVCSLSLGDAPCALAPYSRDPMAPWASTPLTLCRLALLKR
eukprot:8038078-Pyramimonas_sp.AAC.1